MAEFSVFGFILAIASAAGLLVWSVRLVRTGFERAFGSEIRAGLRKSTRSRIGAAATGGVAAFLLQSSTGVAMLVSGFMASKAIAPLAAFAMLLGADVGSALVAQVLVIETEVVRAGLLLSGCVLYLRAQRQKPRECGRIMVGLGLILLSLNMISTASEPLLEVEAARVVFVYLSQELGLAFVISAILAWVMHSSLAAVLLWVTFAAQGILPVDVAMAMVLGANLGGAFIAFALTLGAETDVRRVILSNVIWRGGVATLCLIPVIHFTGVFAWLGSTEGQQVLNLHLFVNVVMLCVGVPLTKGVMALASVFVTPSTTAPAEQGLTGLLDRTAQVTPGRALDLATRTLMHIGERVEMTLNAAMGLYSSFDEDVANKVRDDYQLVRASVRDLKFYLARLDQNQMDDDALQRSHDLVEAAIHLASGAEVISEKLVGLSHQLHVENLEFSVAGKRELEDMYDQVLQNVQLGINVLMTQNASAARSLVECKSKVRELEKVLRRRHLDRLQNLGSETTNTSDVHLETLQVLKAVNTAFAMIAYPILEKTGSFLENRLVS